MSLKFFYVLDYNLKNQLLNNLEISQCYPGFNQATVNSKAYTVDVECIQAAVDILQQKHVEIVTSNESEKVTLDFAELYNPAYAPDGEEDNLDKEDLLLFEENSIVVYLLTDSKTGDWLIKASILIYENVLKRSIH